jgi:hypothetical protein
VTINCLYILPSIAHLLNAVHSSPPPIPAGLAGVLQESSGLCRIASQSLNIGSHSCQAWQSSAELGRTWCQAWQDLAELGRIYFKLEYIMKKPPATIYLYTNIHFFSFHCCICRINPHPTPLLYLHEVQHHFLVLLPSLSINFLFRVCTCLFGPFIP